MMMSHPRAATPHPGGPPTALLPQHEDDSHFCKLFSQQNYTRQKPKIQLPLSDEITFLLLRVTFWIIPISFSFEYDDISLTRALYIMTPTAAV